MDVQSTYKANDSGFSYSVINGIATIILNRPGQYNTLTGDFISAEKAQKKSLINFSTRNEELIFKTAELSKKISEKYQFAVRLGKASYNAQLGQPLAEAYKQTSAELACNLLSNDGQEGLNAFSEKRKLNWIDC